MNAPKTTIELYRAYVQRHRLDWQWATGYAKDVAMRHWLRIVGDQKLSEVDSFAVDKYRAGLRQEVKATSVNSYVRSLRPVFAWAELHGWCPNPFSGSKKLREPEKAIATFRDDQIEMILAHTNQIWRRRILAAVESGLRFGEIVHLRSTDVDFSRDIITIRPHDASDHDFLWQPKHGKSRAVPLCAQLRLALESTETPYPFLTKARYHRLLELRACNKLTPRVAQKLDENRRPWSLCLETCDIHDLTFHDLRRTAITRWSRQMPPQDLIKLAGHADIKTTMQYYARPSDDIFDIARIGATGSER